MVEHTQEATPELIEVLRPAAPATAWCAPTRTPPPAPSSCPPAARCAPQDLGLLAAAGVTEIPVHARPRVAIVSTGDEVVPPRPPDRSPPARSATRAPSRSPRSCARPAASRTSRGIVPTTARRCAAAAAVAVAGCDVVVVSAGSSVGARDETAAVVAGLGEPGIWCHGIALRPGQADAARRLRRRAGDRAARQPALGARRLPARRDADRARSSAACTSRRRAVGARARLARDVPSAAGRLDVVQVARRRRRGAPCSGAPRCSRSSPPPTATSSCPRRPRAWPRAARSRSRCTGSGPTTPFIHDVPAAEALAAGARGVRGGRLPRAGRRGADAARPRRSAG